ncbi:hypothetical protein ACFPZI_30370, partial [Streptomyces chlorus]
MSGRNTWIRSLHDIGLAAWFGGSLMGAAGLNGAAKDEGETDETSARIASSGWAKWAPLNAAAIGAHLFGGGGLLAVRAGVAERLPHPQPHHPPRRPPTRRPSPAA